MGMELKKKKEKKHTGRLSKKYLTMNYTYEL